MSRYRGNQSTPRDDNVSNPQLKLLLALWKANDEGRLLARPKGEGYKSYIRLKPPIHIHGIDITQTKPDYTWLKLQFLGYLEGPPHLKYKRSQRDEAITDRLKSMGYDVGRWPEENGEVMPFTRWTKRLERKIVEKIISIINPKVKNLGYGLRICGERVK